MILLPVGQGLRIVLQTDHAALSGLLARRWGNERFAAPQPLAPIVRAASLHDLGWERWESAPALDPETGQPYSFLRIPLSQHLALYRDGIRRVAAGDPYAGLLVSMHGVGLYNGRYGAEEDRRSSGRFSPRERERIEDFVAEQEELQDTLARRSGRPESGPARVRWEERLRAHYRWLQAWDILSLFPCMKDLAGFPEHRVEPVPPAPGVDSVRLTIRGTGPNTVTVDPFPFAGPVTAEVPCRIVPDRRHADESSFRAAWEAAPRDAFPVTFRPPERGDS